MGTFDSLLVNCPDCGNRMEFQSKARTGHGGNFEIFEATSAPDWLRFDLVGDEARLRN